MPRDNEGRIVILADVSPKRMLRIAEEIAIQSSCIVDDIADADLDPKDDDGFQIVQAEGEPVIYTLGALLMKAAGGMKIPMDIVVSARRTKRGDGRLTVHWIETGSAMRPHVCQNFAESLANELEVRIEDDGGEIINSFDD